MDLTRGVSIVIPLRVDNPERAENLRFILSLLLQQTEVSVDILEADTEQRFYLSETCERLRYRFVKDDDPVFYRTRYLNILLRSAKFPIAGILGYGCDYSAGSVERSGRQDLFGLCDVFPV